LQLAKDNSSGPGFFAIFPLLGGMVLRVFKRLLNPTVLASVEKSSNASGEKSEAQALFEAELERNPHQAQHRSHDDLLPPNADRDLIQLAAKGDLYLPAARSEK
jgi:hypothetical protein